MESIKLVATGMCLGVMVALPLTAAADEVSPGAVEAIRIATEAYVYGYPLVTFDLARRQQTNVAVPDYPTNTVVHVPALIANLCRTRRGATSSNQNPRR